MDFLTTLAGKALVALALAALLLLGGFGAGYHLRGLSADKASAKLQNNLLADQLNNINKQLQLQAAGQEKLDKGLKALPKPETIREIVKQNPSGCVLPAPVADGLRDQVRQANAARPGS